MRNLSSCLSGFRKRFGFQDPYLICAAVALLASCREVVYMNTAKNKWMAVHVHIVEVLYESSWFISQMDVTAETKCIAADPCA